MVYMGAMYMHIHGVYGCYILVYSLCIWVPDTCIFSMDMGAIYMYIDCVYGCHLHVY